MHQVESSPHTQFMDDFWKNNFADLSKRAGIPFWILSRVYKLSSFEMKWGGLYVLPLAIIGSSKCQLRAERCRLLLRRLDRDGQSLGFELVLV